MRSHMMAHRSHLRSCDDGDDEDDEDDDDDDDEDDDDDDDEETITAAGRALAQ